MSRPALRTYHEHDDKVHAHILIARYAHRTTMARGPALLLDTRHFSRSSHSTIPIKHPTNHFHHLHFPGPSNVQGGLSFRQPYNRAGERISRFSRRGSSAESSEVCILDHRLLSAHAMRLPRLLPSHFTVPPDATQQAGLQGPHAARTQTGRAAPALGRRP